MFLTLSPRRPQLVTALISVTLLLFLSAIGCAAQNLAKSTVLNDCAKVFGESIDTRLNLFEVNPSFVLQPQFDEHDNLTRLSVFPKYFLEEEHPEWTEPPHWPLFLPAEFKSLLNRLDKIVSKGKLVEPGIGGVVTNSTSYFLDKYEHAYVNHGNVIDDVRFVHVYPFHEIEGKVQKIRQDSSAVGNVF